MAQRGLSKNVLLEAGITLTPSSEDLSFPVEGLQDQQRQYFWRTATGWTIVASFNDRIDFNRGGVLVATVAAGTYATAALLCTAVIAALEAADPTPVWNCTYSALHLFTISTAAHNFVLLFGTGTNLTRSIGPDMGYSVADTASAMSSQAFDRSYQSRHFLVIEVPAASRPDGITAALLAEHNIDPGFPISVRLQANATNVWTAPTLNVDFGAVLQAGEEASKLYFSDPNLSFYRLVVQDTYNPDGYFELGVMWLSPHMELSKTKIESSIQHAQDDTSKLEEGLDGTLYVDFGRTRDRLSLAWRILGVNDQALLDAFFDAILAGECWVLDLDTTSNTAARYGYFPSRPVKQNITSFAANYSHEFVGAL